MQKINNYKIYNNKINNFLNNQKFQKNFHNNNNKYNKN